MTRPDRPIIIRLSSQQAMRPELLEGLETWLQLGLLSDLQVKQLCQEYLTCPLPTPTTLSTEAEPDRAIGNARQDPTRDFERLPSLPPSPIPDRSPVLSRSWIGRSLQSFMAEISVIWLLFLGVFLVVVSSGVLATSQWQNFPPVGQYGILFTYTLAFFAASLWTSRQQTLRLTARTLQITTLLIIPINFWMIDGLKLWQSVAGLAMGTIAALTLTAITRFLLRPTSDLIQSANPRLTTLNSLALSWLHWGWSLAGIPLIATYIGTIGTALSLFFQLRQPPHPPISP
ncbi:MAG: hypothetical protein HC769_34655, partial [Cyanobacteria bacterium CRU_2_1]|nr:hypothetical protein [Cyanobacteria bacterium CRU_2_1]